MKIIPSKNTYLDFASATPMDKRVLKLMFSYDNDFFANATSIHKEGVRARSIIEDARKSIAKGLNAHSDEIVFTGSSTESNAMVILGVVNSYKLLTANKGQIPHIITSSIEHPAVLENCRKLEERGEVEVTYVSINEKGIIDPKDIKNAIKENTALISIMYANNEIGTIQPIQEIAKEIRHYRKGRNKFCEENSLKVHGYFPGEKFLVLGSTASQGTLKEHSSQNLFPVFHTDATQAMNYLYTGNVEKLGVNLLSFNGSKIYGPKGVGILYKKRGIKLSPIYSGGEQEFGLRSGTENVSSVAGISLAFEIANKMKDKEVVRLTKIRDYAIDKLLSMSNNNFSIILNGDKVQRLPNNINISVSGISSELLVIELDAKGIEISSKSACKSGEDNGSYVIEALRKAKNEKFKEEEGSLRITLGRDTTKTDVNKFLSTLSKILEKYSKWKK